MSKESWRNLPVKNTNRSKKFFSAFGCRFSNGPVAMPFSALPSIGNKAVTVMLFGEPTFKGFVKQEITDMERSWEVLLSFDASAKEEVDGMAGKLAGAGGRTAHTPHEMKGAMHGCVFSDPDGHKWNVLYVAGQQFKPTNENESAQILDDRSIHIPLGEI
jgi:predicted lactoylglutathione lyase